MSVESQTPVRARSDWRQIDADDPPQRPFNIFNRIADRLLITNNLALAQTGAATAIGVSGGKEIFLMKGTCTPERPCSVLIVEDDATQRLLLNEALQRYAPSCFWSHEVPSLGDALRAIGSITFDCIVVDLGLGDSEGLDTVDRLVAQLKGSTPFIVITGRNDPALEEQAFERGAAEYVVKPYDERRVVNRLRHSIMRHRWLLSQVRILGEQIAAIKAGSIPAESKALAMASQIVSDLEQVVATLKLGAAG